MEELMGPEEAYYRGIHFLPLRTPEAGAITIKNSMAGLEDGPCELLFRDQAMPAIDDFDDTLKYALGVAMRGIGFSLDRAGISPDEALLIYGELAEAMATYAQRSSGAEVEPYSVDMLVDEFLRMRGDLFRHVDIRTFIQKYVDQARNLEPTAETPTSDSWPIYADPSTKRACESLVGNVPTYHVASEVYDQSEISAWPAVAIDSRMLPAPAFMIAVDGETWLKVNGTPFQAQSEWLLVDARQRHWYLYERAKSRGPGVKAGASQVVGAVCNTLTGEYHPIASSNIFVRQADSLRPWTWNASEAGRLVRVALTFVMLLQHKSVRVTGHKIKGHRNVLLPRGRSVDDIISEVLRREPPA